MVKSKRYYAERVIDGLQNRQPNIDFKIDEREVFLAVDDVVNAFAEQNFFDNWKFTGAAIDEQFITTFSDVIVVDQSDELPSYFEMPANYAALPYNAGINDIRPLKYQKDGKDFSVVVISRTDHRKYKNLQAGRFEKRLAGYPEGQRFYFTTNKVKANFGNMDVSLVIRDSSAISETAPYPIPSNFEGRVIQACIEYFTEKRLMQTDTVRDKNDVVNPAPRRFINNGGE